MKRKNFAIVTLLPLFFFQIAFAQDGLEAVDSFESIEPIETIIQDLPQDDSVVTEAFSPQSSSGGESMYSGSMNQITTTTYQVDRAYTIQTGDTLWDICNLLMDNPYYWPKLWSLNQYILNPHLIYPGQTLVFTPGTESSFPNLEIVDGFEETPFEVVQAQSKPKGLDQDIYRPLPDPFGDTVIEQSFATGVGVSIRLRNISIVPPKGVRTVGKVTHSGEPRMQLSFPDRVYLDFFRADHRNNAKVGDKFFVIEKVKRVPNPSGGGTIGLMVKKQAVVEVTQIRTSPTNRKRKVVEARVIDGDSSFVRGSELMEFRPNVIELVPHYTDQLIQGRIAGGDNTQIMISNNDFVFLNIGSRHGLEPGVQLYVVRRGDGIGFGTDRNLPDVPVGRIMIVETWDTTSTAYVVTLEQHLEIGDRVISLIE